MWRFTPAYSGNSQNNACEDKHCENNSELQPSLNAERVWFPENMRVYLSNVLLHIFRSRARRRDGMNETERR